MRQITTTKQSDPFADFTNSVLAFGADLQRGFNTYAPYISPLYGGINYLSGGYGKTFGEWGETLQQEKAPIQEAARNVGDAWKATVEWGEDVQKNISWFANGAAGFLNTAGNFVNALSGQSGILGSIGTMLPFLVVILILGGRFLK